MNKSKQHKRSRDDWRTPRWLFDALDKEYRFGIDVAADKDNALCNSHYSEKQSALTVLSWPWRWWCNPPYSRKQDFIGHAARQRVPGVLLLPSSTDAQWWHGAYVVATHVALIRGRVQFELPDRKGGNNTGGSTLFVFGLPPVEHERFLWIK
jgi:phage N-6-adenine-methyltransferase